MDAPIKKCETVFTNKLERKASFLDLKETRDDDGSKSRGFNIHRQNHITTPVDKLQRKTKLLPGVSRPPSNANRNMVSTDLKLQNFDVAWPANF